MAAIYLFLSSKLLQFKNDKQKTDSQLESEKKRMDSYESNDKSNLDIDAFEIAEALIEAFHPQLEIARSGTKLKHFDAISGYLYGLTYGYLKAVDKLSHDNHFSLMENIHLGVFGDINDVANMLREHFVNNSYYRTEFGKLVFNHAAEDGFQFAKTDGEAALRLNQVIVAAKKHDSSGLEEALHLLGKGTRAALNFTKASFKDTASQFKEEFKRCPFCDEKVKPRAKKCKHCGEWFSQSEEVIKSKTKTTKKIPKKTKSVKPKAKTLEKDADTGTAANAVMSEIQLIMREVSRSNTAAKLKVQSSNFALGYLLGYVDGYLQRNQLFETDDVERIAICTQVFIDIFGHKEGSRIFGTALGQQLDNKDIHLGMRVGGEEGFRQVDPHESSLPKEFL